MSGSHGSLYLAGHSPLHTAAAEVKIVAAIVAVFAVVATPRELVWPFAVYAVLVLAVWRWARIPLRWIGPRMAIELPFVVLALLLPFAADGPRTDVLGLTLSTSGLIAAWGILVKGTLGVAISLTLAATTSVRDLPGGLSKLRVPGLIVTIVVLMLRYVDLLVDEARRMRLARVSRGADPRNVAQAAATARGAGALFLRSYERGERVHVAMLSRGFTGSVPDYGCAIATPRVWAIGMIPALLAVVVCLGGWWSL
ncbi:cobalt ECF transporter T component CbiQ [Antrihabitans sp. YC2-6]|uniref:cobalt ECF transporter T component CbiQ n=1 Tax=Antrihabitans sp. YC2-6 TaxID=2799498 RepID=UPI0018F365DA|nr:cobalt ECF transporter T component CbiQ [Antrihabitans sp. YC2-6]MBJ8346501.1 cobalt ECF transporter T component CbiQ [Antrihabitans sp. YC2-6]